LFSLDETHIIMGLQNGYIWVSGIQTGELVTLFAAHRNPLTVLANHNQPDQIYSGAADGTLSLIEYESGQLLQNYHGHQTQIYAIVPYPAGGGLASLDITGRFIYWDAQTGVILRERSLASVPSSNLQWFIANSEEISEEFDLHSDWLIAGTKQGQVFRLDDDFQYQNMYQFDSPISFVYPVEARYLIVGGQDGWICVVGTPE
jgi:WD40 repeat protein